MTLPQTGGNASAEKIAAVARGAEDIGLDSLWVMDRLLRPLAPVDRVPGQKPELLPEYYGSVFDPLEILTYSAALTTSVLLGTSAINASFHPPVVLARRFATLDQLSDGRVIAGLSQGWMPEEFALAGVPMAERSQRFIDHVTAMRAVWGTDPVEHHGMHYAIPRSEIGPKPAQPGGIPVIAGAYAPSAIERAATFADGFNPLATTFEGLTHQIDLFRSAARRAGRDLDSLQIVVRVNTSLNAARGKGLFSGSIQNWIADLDQI